jgi:hypothetical protein
MKWYEAAGIGAIMGGLFGLILWAAFDSLKLASVYKYGNIYHMPLTITLWTTFIAFCILFSVQFWYPFVERVLYELAEQLEEYEPDNDLDDER